MEVLIQSRGDMIFLLALWLFSFSAKPPSTIPGLSFPFCHFSITLYISVGLSAACCFLFFLHSYISLFAASSSLDSFFPNCVRRMWKLGYIMSNKVRDKLASNISGSDCYWLKCCKKKCAIHCKSSLDMNRIFRKQGSRKLKSNFLFSCLARRLDIPRSSIPRSLSTWLFSAWILLYHSPSLSQYLSQQIGADS